MTQHVPEIRRLTDADAAAYRAVRLAALQNDPLAFVTTAQEFAQRTPESIAEQLAPKPDSFTFGAFLQGELVGLLTVMRESRMSIRHRANIVGVSVLPQARGQGCGEALLRAGIAQAQAWSGVTSLHLTVTETQKAAQRLYERHGFVLWGTQPDALRHDGQTYSELWLWRPVPSPF